MSLDIPIQLRNRQHAEFNRRRERSGRRSREIGKRKGKDGRSVSTARPSLTISWPLPSSSCWSQSHSNVSMSHSRALPCSFSFFRHQSVYFHPAWLVQNENFCPLCPLRKDLPFLPCLAVVTGVLCFAPIAHNTERSDFRRRRALHCPARHGAGPASQGSPGVRHPRAEHPMSAPGVELTQGLGAAAQAR